MEERLLEEQRRLEEEAGPGADKNLVDAAAKVLGENNKNQVRGGGGSCDQVEIVFKGDRGGE